jgi:predicted acylesterase/phospholipase RssA
MGMTVLALGGGAPNFTLITGALLAFDEAGVKIDRISMAGFGSVVGLLYMAPQGGDRRQALENTVNYGVSDLIYSMFPVNYKLFQQAGPSAERFRAWFARLTGMQRWLNQYGMSDTQRLYSDWLQFMAAMMCPNGVNWFSAGLSAHAAFEEVVDFDALKDSLIDCHLNAYCIEDNAPVTFEKHEIDVHTFRAGLSLPYLNPPYRLNGKHYLEGAAFQALSLKSLVREHDVDKIIAMDVLRDGLVTLPRNIWDAYSQSIIMPLIALAGRELALFEYWVRTGIDVDLNPWETVRAGAVAGMPEPPAQPPNVQLFQIQLTVPEEHKPYSLNWARSNLDYLFRMGYDRGREFMRQPVNQVLIG